MENNINIDLVKIEQFILNLKIENTNKIKKLRRKTKKRKRIIKTNRCVLFISDSSGEEY